MGELEDERDKRYNERHQIVVKEIDGLKEEVGGIKEEVGGIKEAVQKLTVIAEQLTKKSSFWQTPTGSKILVGGFWLLALIILKATDIKSIPDLPFFK